ncbi:MAG: hypothetical protein ACRDVG_13795 [Jatrophihabitantaceae bacterium]
MNTIVRWGLVLVAAVGLGIDAYTHFDLASQYAFNKTSVISEATLFRIEAVLAILVGVALFVRVNLWTVLAAFLVAAGGLALLLLYRYVNVGKLGPIPNMYDPGWFTEKQVAAWGEGVAAAATLALGVLVIPGRRRIRS